MITHGAAAFLGLLLIILSMRVIALRGNPLFGFFAMGKGDDDVLARAVRGHGNLTEYAPVFLILLYLAETGGAMHGYLLVLAVLFCVGRLMHGIVFGFLTRNPFLRIGGTATTLTVILLLSIENLRLLF